MADDTLKSLVDLIRSKVNCECLYLYGSRAIGTAQEEKSDYDFLAIARLPSIVASIRKLHSLRRTLEEATPVRVDLTFLTPQSTYRFRSSLPLMVWNRTAKLVYGRKDILREFHVGSFAPDEESVAYYVCHEVEWLLRHIDIDRNLGASIDHRALTKLSGLLADDILLGAGSLRGAKELASSIQTEAMKENCDVHSVCRSCADFLEGIRGQFSTYGHPSALQYVRSAISILAETLRLHSLTTPRRRTTQYQLVSALLYVYQSLETNPISTDLLLRAFQVLGSPPASEVTPSSINSGDGYTFELWARVRLRIREDWDSVMNYPFGRVAFYRQFAVVLV